ncbi:Vitamin B12 dependent methionine synthase%2C activation domain [uncultured Ruminococcus sp.]|uniref:Methionine synthase n=1 Tax=Massiliimalia timonensis TaxID=1987501 RepID=A0A8J6TQV1_9FIRM|nr:vitamin B12 dependent-methionine synthase activation domain-containing protein [Massiliimalia timonensis]MBC8609746.1 methionine synthase [Massiliimalia timonensis]MBS7175332.1 methionine synthase [Clostridiales bacterium]SCH27547.1 Vitamin B12 dependent methionine synthase%2C activation domain [uncultured Ruminococcus sp.]SCH31902.1 Vitamin B12 dependent methionine synthase%2C activation domain [uncultured Clostridium sp.]
MQTLIQTLNRDEILRYLGYQGQDISPALEDTLHRCMGRTLEMISPKYLYRRFKIEHRENGIAVLGTPVFLSGQDIRRHLENCEEIYLLCVTVGLEIEREIRTAMLLSPDEGVILDSCATTAVEALADLAEREIAAQCKTEGKNITWRFSAGYGDLPLETQKEIIAAMDTHRKIGLSLTDSLLMTPSKSVTAIIGVTDTTRDPRPNKCDYCNNRAHCAFRKRGTQC